jgi:hypothetical protein
MDQTGGRCRQIESDAIVSQVTDRRSQGMLKLKYHIDVSDAAAEPP